MSGITAGGRVPGLERWNRAKITEESTNPNNFEFFHLEISSSIIPRKIHSSRIGRIVTVANNRGRDILAISMKMYSSSE